MKDARPPALGRELRALPRSLSIVAVLAAVSLGCKSDKKSAAVTTAEDATPAREVNPAEVPYEALIELGSLATIQLGPTCSEEKSALRSIGADMEALRNALANTSEAARVADLFAETSGKLSTRVAPDGTDLPDERRRNIEELEALLTDLKEAFSHAATSIDKAQGPAASAARTRIDNAAENLKLTVQRLEAACAAP